MIILLIKYLESLNIKIPSVFLYTSTRMILASITSLFITLFLSPYFIKKLKKFKIKESIKKQAPYLEKLHNVKKDTPTMGGFLIIFSILISLFLFMDFSSIFTWVLLFSTIFLCIVGFFDDFLKLKKKRGVSVKVKFFSQFFLAALVAFYLISPFLEKKVSYPIAKEYVKDKVETLEKKEYISRVYVPFYKKPFFLKSSILIFLFIILVIVGSSNSVNLTDGLDGLAVGVVIMVSLVLSIFAFLSSNIEIAKYLNILYIEKSSEIAIYLLSLVGASLGFLWYNGYPAQIFMGDTGSLPIGGILGISAILLRREFILALSGGIFVLEAVSVLLQVLFYKYRGKRIFLCAPLHHHFEYRGWKEPKVVIRFWIIAFFLATIAVASLKFQ